MIAILISALPYAAVLILSLIATLILTPIVREMNRSLGMVDKPDPRRVNIVPIPRGGGLALIIGLIVPYLAFHFITKRPALQGISDVTFYKMTFLSIAIGVLGYVDDLFNIKPRIKLFFQILVALATWWWAGMGFSDIYPQIPAWVDCIITVFWVVGAVNAFNLIDGLDGLASGVALFATIGIGGTLFYVKNPEATLFYFAFAGGLLGFLRYNFNPASIFLGDCGSMFIGFIVSTLPLASQVPNSFLVSIGMPLLAMGVPIFDTALAILRRTIRKVLYRGQDNMHVMEADKDHLHHRILRSSGMNQRRAVVLLYAATIAAVSVGIIAMYLESRAAGLWLLASVVAAIIIFKDLSAVELLDASSILKNVAQSKKVESRRMWMRVSTVFYLAFDVVALVLTYILVCLLLSIPLELASFKRYLTIRAFFSFMGLVVMRVYLTHWSRAMLSNFARLVAGCVIGTIASTVLLYYLYSETMESLGLFSVLYSLISFCFIAGIRLLRPFIRDLFYAMDCSRLKDKKSVSRILVYGTGLRYRAFRRELVRNTSANERIIVGLLDDDLLLKGRYVGGLKIQGTIHSAPLIIEKFNVDTIVIACDLTEQKEKIVKEILAPTGVKIRKFLFTEKEI